jgi:type II secretory ATPase GspE/PulE/Tfp pilus assembly ATPase PilB-like protein/putative methionine-R-sulfoxide reductase with GAF domain
MNPGDISAHEGSFKRILSGMKKGILSSYQVEMATIYFVDSTQKEIFSWAVLPGNSLSSIRIPIGSKSIAGYVAQNRKVVAVQNVYNNQELISIDPALSFDPTWDRKTGVTTRQVLAVPILCHKSLLGVVQLINKQTGEVFTVEDQKQLFDLTESLGNAFINLNEYTRNNPSKYELLLNNKIISKQNLVNARAIANRQNRDVEFVLQRDFKVTRSDLGKSLAQFYKTPYENLATSSYNPISLLKGKNLEYFRQAHCIPLVKKGEKTILAIDDPNDQIKIQEIMQILRTDDVELRVALKEEIEEFIDVIKPKIKVSERFKTPERSFRDILDEMKGQDDYIGQFDEEVDGPAADDHAIVLLVRKIIEEACEQNASDIHIEPYGAKQDAEVRYRIDGRCSKVLTIPKHHIRAIVSRFKILAQLDISERRQPQDGKIRFKTSSGKNVEIRVSTIPTVEGNEDIVLRLLSNNFAIQLDKLMPQRIFKSFSQLIQKPYGMVLVVGPTGSGKTTTLHSALNHINTPERKIWTAEDPVEITQFRLRQVQINPKIGFTFAAAMRAFLRADPDVIMVGEMRDQETVKIAIEASLTGHLVFSTLHTNSAPETITRLVDMGMDPFNFADALIGILSQRLVRTLCKKCKKPYHPSSLAYTHLKKMYGPAFDKEVRIPYSDGLKLYQAGGCEECGNSGYKGRMGLFEMLVGSKLIKRSIIGRAGVEKIRRLAISEGMTTLIQEGVQNIFSGHTDPKQVISVCS